MPETLRFQLQADGPAWIGHLPLPCRQSSLSLRLWIACLDRSRDLLARGVDEALLRVERQRERIAELVQTGQPTKAAEDLLAILLCLFADLVELEHKINALLQAHNNVARELSVFEDVQSAIKSAHIGFKRQLSGASGPLIQMEGVGLRQGVESWKKRAMSRSNIARNAKCGPRRRRAS